MNKIDQNLLFRAKSAVRRGLEGFTLIELLVVVLVIGLLAAVALPQYRVAAAKAKVSRALPLFRSITDAQDRYFMQTGEYTAELDLLDIRVPYTSKEPHEGGEERWRYSVNPLGQFTVSPNHFLVWSSGDGFTIDYYGKTANRGYTAICYPRKENTTGHQVCKSFGRDTGRMSSTEPPTPVYALDF